MLTRLAFASVSSSEELDPACHPSRLHQRSLYEAHLHQARAAIYRGRAWGAVRIVCDHVRFSAIISVDYDVPRNELLALRLRRFDGSRWAAYTWSRRVVATLARRP